MLGAAERFVLVVGVIVPWIVMRIIISIGIWIVIACVVNVNLGDNFLFWLDNSNWSSA